MTVRNKEQMILDALERDQIVYTIRLAEELDASEATIRRTLIKLEQEGKLRRILGGATLSLASHIRTEDEPFMSRRSAIHPIEKRLAAERAAELVQDGDYVFLDGGSSTAPMMEHLKSRPITIVTNNHLALSCLDEATKASVITIGGTYIPRYSMSAGTDALRQMEPFSFDICFLSCIGADLSEDMSYTTETGTMEIKQRAFGSSRKSVLLLDTSKIGLRGFCKLSPLSSFDTIFCAGTDAPDVIPDNMIFLPTESN